MRVIGNFLNRLKTSRGMFLTSLSLLIVSTLSSAEYIRSYRKTDNGIVEYNANRIVSYEDIDIPKRIPTPITKKFIRQKYHFSFELLFNLEQVKDESIDDTQLFFTNSPKTISESTILLQINFLKQDKLNRNKTKTFDTVKRDKSNKDIKAFPTENFGNLKIDRIEYSVSNKFDKFYETNEVSYIVSGDKGYDYNLIFNTFEKEENKKLDTIIKSIKTLE
jgi:hypothetical protein